MGYFLLLLALLAGATKGFCGKKMSSGIVATSDSMVLNVLRMLLCIVIGFLLMLVQNHISDIIPDVFLILASALAGVSSAVFVVSWLLSVRQGAYMMVEVFLLIGVFVPISLCRIFFEEAIGIWQFVGIALLGVSVLIMCTYNVSIKGKITRGALALLLLCGLANGLTDFSQKLYVKIRPEGSIAAFNFYTYAFAAVVLLFACIFFRRADRQKAEKLRTPLEIIKPFALYVIIMALCLFANSYFKTQAALYLDAVYMYPFVQGGGVILSLLMSALLFKEKINAKCIVGLSLSFVALLLINLQ